MHILITGGTGLIGRALTEKLGSEGHTVAILSRSGGDFTWNVKKHYMDPLALQNVDAIVHLAGAGIAEKRWSVARKKEIVDSRVESARLLVDTLANNNHQVKTVVSASGIGYYGSDTGETNCTETSNPGVDFVAECTQEWEKSVDPFTDQGIRVVKLRTGLVMASQGGIFRVLTRPVYWFIGAILGTGKQWQSWIHMDDLVEIFHQSLINSSASGVYNAVAPEPIRHGDMIRMIAKKLKRPLIFPAIPTWFLRIILGEMADLVTGGNFVSSQKIQKELTFTFKFTSFAEAIKKLTYV
jgi:uncharacterized protein (TIGR01777 family)